MVRWFLGWSSHPGSRALSGPALLVASPSAIHPVFRALVSSYNKGFAEAIKAGSLIVKAVTWDMAKQAARTDSVELLLHYCRCIHLEAGIGP